jgi:hypothetical protein
LDQQVQQVQQVILVQPVELVQPVILVKLAQPDNTEHMDQLVEQGQLE